MKLSVTTALASVAHASAACTDVANGFASLNGGTKGGLGGTVVTVNNLADLKKYASADGPHIIKVQGTITVTPFGNEIKVTNDKTIIGLGASATIDQGGFGMNGAKNVIIRNLRIGNTVGDGAENDRDGIQVDSSSNIWIDHCIFENIGDGSVDLRKDTTYWTVSNNIFRKTNKSFGIGWTDNVTAEGTLHHNWFDGTNQRNPSADNLRHAHMYNNYLNGVTSYGHYARGGTNARIENVYFQNTKNPITADAGATLTSTGSVFAGSSGQPAANQGTAFKASDYYQYTLDATANVPNVVQANAGPRASVCS